MSSSSLSRSAYRATIFIAVSLFSAAFAQHANSIALCYKVIGNADSSIPTYNRDTSPDIYNINTNDCRRGFKPASGTVYNSWPKPGSVECIDYSGCKYAGQFSQINGGELPTCRRPARPLERPDGRDLMCRFPKRIVRKWKIGATWEGRKDLLNKKVQVRLSKKEGSKLLGDFNIVDTCSDKDCQGCCSKNTSNGKYPLIDMELSAYCQKIRPCPKDSLSLNHPPNHRPA